MQVLDLFSGIGGFSLGLERAGMKTAAFCEINPFCRQVLAKNWPEVPCYEDVTALTGELVRRDVGGIDVIAFGFPCQDVSVAGTGKGLEGDRSGLWREGWRLISELRPRYAITENVAALTGRGLDRVLGDLASIGYDAEWHCIPASAVGAPHIRDRIWIVAYPASVRCQGDQLVTGRDETAESTRRLRQSARGGADVAYPNSNAVRTEQGWGKPERTGKAIPPHNGAPGSLAHSHSIAAFGPAIARQERRSWGSGAGIRRVAHGVPRRMDRIKALGNSVVPQIPEIIGRAIMQVEAA